MRIFRRVLAIVVVAIGSLVCANNAQAQKGETTFGVQTGYTSTNNSAVAGLFFQYGLSRTLRIAPEVGCVFRHHDKDAFTADLNFHFPLNVVSGGDVQLYPLIGLDYSSWNLMGVTSADDADVTTRHNRFGANFGAGFQLKPSSTLKIKAEVKYTLTSKYSTFVASLGIGYIF